MGFSVYPVLMQLEDILKGGNTRKHYNQLRRLMHADPEYLNEYKLAALQKLLKHVYANVPYYKKEFDSLGVQPEDIKSFEDFSKLPTLNRETVKSNAHNFFSDAHDRASIMAGYTSGSSGTPMMFHYDRKSYSAGRAAVLVGWELAGKKMRDKIITVWGDRSTAEEKWPKLDSRLKAILYRNKRIPSYSLSEEGKILRALDIMRGRRGGYVFGYTNAIYTLASYAKDHEIDFEVKFDGVLTTAENLFPHHRKTIEEVMGPVYDGYGCQEILGIAYQCQERKDYHIIEPNVIFETEDCVDDSKEIIVTDLWNYAWPLLRYKPGDLVSGEMKRGCACGCTWSTFERVDGRTTDVITGPDGRRIYYTLWLVVSFILDNHPDIKQFQWIKESHDKLILKLLLHNGPDAAIVENIKLNVEPYFKDIIGFEVQFVDKFETSPSGKHQVVVDLTK